MKNTYLKNVLTLCFFILCARGAAAQVLVSDPALAALTLGNGIMENKANDNIREKQRAIEALQVSTVSVVNFLNDWHRKMYNGLIQVGATVSDAYQVKECIEVLADIYQLEKDMIAEAQPNPLALGFAVRFQREMVVKAIQYYSEIHQFILKEGDAKLLMDAGERTNLLRQVLTDLRTIKAYAATSYYRVKWAVKNGIIQSLNPFAAFVNQDTRIVRDILRTWQY
jgi:hypothetical protein